MSVIDRIKEINSYKGISVRQFCIEVGIANGYLDKVKDVGSEKLLKILNTYPEISPEWLLTGQGSMLKGSDTDIQIDTTNIDKLLNIIKEKDCQIANLNREIGGLEAELRILKKQLIHP